MSGATQGQGAEDVGRRPAGPAETLAANRAWWDRQALDYYAEHGRFLGDEDLVWGPEGLREAQAGLLGELAGRRVLEVGSGAAQGSRYAARLGAAVVASDVSAGMLAQAGRIGTSFPLIQCDASRLPFMDGSFDLVFTAYGAVPFVADAAGLVREWARVLRPGGRLVYSTTHPFRWAFPDDPGPDGLTVRFSYFDRTPYVESVGGRATYVEHHRTLGDRVRDVVGAGLRLVDLVEPPWQDGNDQEWGGWSPLRGSLVPGTVVMVAEKPS